MAQKTAVKEERWIAVQCAYCQVKGKGVVTIKEAVRTCPTCGGRGRAESEHDLPCLTCSGKGVISA